MDHSIGVYVIDRFTYYALEFLESVDQNSKRTVKDLVSKFVKLLTIRIELIFQYITQSSIVVRSISVSQRWRTEPICYREA
jgi:glycosylphosphatidylinositol transamidase (GPIT) subunit GPI8